jgi:hypothetical protein
MRWLNLSEHDINREGSKFKDSLVDDEDIKEWLSTKWGRLFLHLPGVEKICEASLSRMMEGTGVDILSPVSIDMVDKDDYW